MAKASEDWYHCKLQAMIWVILFSDLLGQTVVGHGHLAVTLINRIKHCELPCFRTVRMTIADYLRRVIEHTANGIIIQVGEYDNLHDRSAKCGWSVYG